MVPFGCRLVPLLGRLVPIIGPAISLVSGSVPLVAGLVPLFTGPVPLTGEACRRPCGIAQVMDRAERAWRQELAATTIADLVDSSGSGAVTRVGSWLATLPKVP